MSRSSRDAMTARKHVHEEMFATTAERLFDLLVRPSAIRSWWGANRAVVIPSEGGTWAVAWGPDEDDPDYVTAATIRELTPPERLVLADYRYHAKEGPLPFEADFVTEFLVVPLNEGTMLRVTQDGFPAGPEADAFYAGCRTGWMDTFAGMRAFLELG